MLVALGVTVRLCQDSHLCCGSAGTYSMLQPALSQELLGRKLTNLLKTEPQEIVSSNVGCINHLQSGTDVPVRHWIELIDRMI
jgi:glycolate oxidase iron-sulfur subunit